MLPKRGERSFELHDLALDLDQFVVLLPCGPQSPRWRQGSSLAFGSPEVGFEQHLVLADTTERRIQVRDTLLEHRHLCGVLLNLIREPAVRGRPEIRQLLLDGFEFSLCASPTGLSKTSS